jgi:hypothetical protein
MALLLSRVLYKAERSEKPHIGFASGYLTSLQVRPHTMGHARAQPGSACFFDFEPCRSFHLPDDPATPMLWVAAGTGASVFRGFLMERMHMARQLARQGGASSMLLRPPSQQLCVQCVVHLTAPPARMICATVPPSGRAWRKLGDEQPSNGEELINERLAAALQVKLTFSHEEVADFALAALHAGSFVKAGTCYFAPTLLGPATFLFGCRDASGELLASEAHEALACACAPATNQRAA